MYSLLFSRFWLIFPEREHHDGETGIITGFFLVERGWMVSFLEGLEKWTTRISIAFTSRTPPYLSKQPPSSTLSVVTTPTEAVASVDKPPSMAMEFTLQITLPPPYTYDLLLFEEFDISPSSDLLPSYREHKRSPRCEEDILNPAPSYVSQFAGAQPSGADKLADWLVARTRSTRSGKKSKSIRNTNGSGRGGVQRGRSVLTLRR